MFLPSRPSYKLLSVEPSFNRELKRKLNFEDECHSHFLILTSTKILVKFGYKAAFFCTIDFTCSRNLLSEARQMPINCISKYNTVEDFVISDLVITRFHCIPKVW